KTECEIRFLIKNVEAFESRLKNIDHEVIKEYAFTDHIYKPNNLTKKWQNFEKIMRIRSWSRPKKKSELLFSSVKIEKHDGFTFKRSIFPQGKIIFYSGDFEEASKIASELDFYPWFKIEKFNGKLITVKEGNFSFVIEDIKDLGLTIEIEVWEEKPEKIRNRFNEILNILCLREEDARYHPLARIYHEANNL
ncbi:MAG: hypothetical protein EAX96_05815, partial [Candidatus Lokiarchaeota archaeon]|nr:hypothetical protein [Candidatus Lokiarchaeota archaeon]